MIKARHQLGVTLLFMSLGKLESQLNTVDTIFVTLDWCLVCEHCFHTQLQTLTEMVSSLSRLLLSFNSQLQHSTLATPSHPHNRTLKPHHPGPSQSI